MAVAGEAVTGELTAIASDSDIGGTEDSSSSVSTVSLLDRLKAPRLSDLARKRVTKKNPPRYAKLVLGWVSCTCN